MKSHGLALISKLFWGINNIILILSITVAAVSCAIEPVPKSSQARNKGISVNVLECNDISTKSEASEERLFDSFSIDSIGGQVLKIDAYESDFNPLAFEDGPLTKGAIITTNYLKDSLKAFYLEAYAHEDWFENTKPDGEAGSEANPHKAGYYFGTNTANVTYGSSGWSIYGEPKWINSVDLSFWSWNAAGAGPVIDAVAAGSTPDYSKAGFDYTSDGKSDLIFAYNAEKRVFDEKTGEITGGTGSSSDSKNMDIKFYHALAAIRFDVSGLKNNGLTIKSITISGVYSKGHCNVTGTAGTNSAGTVSFEWPADSLSTTASFTRTFAAADFTETGLDGTTSKALMPMSSDKFLFFIPQAVEDKGITIELVFEDASGTDVTKTASMDHSTDWKAGKFYTYKLTYEGAEYFFSLKSKTESTTPVTTVTKTFNNTTSNSSEVTIPIYSIKEGSTTDNNWDWIIKSYKIGDDEAVTVTGTQFTEGGLIVKQVTGADGKKKLTVQAQKREIESLGSNAYWRNTNSRTENLNWSPADWSSTYTTSNPLDLSKFDFQTDSPTSSMTTANCYIIRHAGTYMIPLVYGNAVDGNSTNITAYNNGTGSTNFLSPFVNHLGNSITSPYIENHTGCQAEDAIIVWSDDQENSPVITGLSITPASGSSSTTYTSSNVRYLKFTVAQSTIRQNNAVIAIRDEDQKIIWSWHIWTTNDPSLLSPPISVINSSVEYKFFPIYNLGWVDATSYVPRKKVEIVLAQKNSDEEEITITVEQPDIPANPSTGVHYQWGRKDPMSTKSAGLPVIPSYSYTTAGVAINTTCVDVKTTILNPKTFYLAYYSTSNNSVANYGDWCKTVYYNLWAGAKNARGPFTLSESTKTVYDPSPVGYMVPPLGAYGAFAYANRSGNFSYGWSFSINGGSGTIFFPASAYRNSNQGVLKAADGSEGNYWSNSRGYNSNTTQIFGEYWAFSSSVSNITNHSNAALGGSVRPVQEQ